METQPKPHSLRLNLLNPGCGASSNLYTTPKHQLKLSLLPANFAICKFASGTSFPLDYLTSSFFSITKTDSELSVVCAESAVPANVIAERGRRMLRVEGPLDFSLTGILASLATPLAEAMISIFALSTYDTDYLLIEAKNIDRAISALEQAGHTISRRQD